MTRKCLTDDKYGKLIRRLDEVKRRVDEGTLPYDSIMSAFTLIIEGEFPKPIFKRDLCKERGYTLIEEGPQHPEGVTVADLELREFLNYDEKYISGKELQKRAVELNARLGQHTVEYLLEHQTEIPEDWRGTYLVFPRTIWQFSDGSRDVPCLGWRDGRWQLSFPWLGCDWSSLYRFAVVSK